MTLPLDRRPVVVAIAGANGAGKTTFYRSHLQAAGLRFMDADVLAGELSLDHYVAGSMGDSLRRELIAQGESFVFETVFSDTVGDKVALGYSTILWFGGISSAEVSDQRVAMRVTQRALREVPHVFIFDNDDLRRPFRLAAVLENGACVQLNKPLPKWLKPIV